MEPIKKPWYASKTIMVNIAAAIALVVAQFQPEFAKIITESFGEVGLGWVFVNLVLRMVTKEAIQIG